MDVRKIQSEEEREAYSKLCRYAFEPNHNNYEGMEFPPETIPNDDLYGCFDDGRLISGLNVIPFPALKIRGKDFSMVGVAGVATKPEDRNRGAVRALFAQMFEDNYNDGVAFSVLYPFSYAYYEMFGYALADENMLYQFPISSIKRKKFPNRYFREVEGITGEIRSVYQQFTEKFNYMTDRPEHMWNNRNKYSGYKFVCYDENDTAVGYAFLFFLKEDRFLEEPARTLALMEYCWLDPITRQAILTDLVWSHRDHRKYVAFAHPTNQNVIDLLDNPRVTRWIIRPNSMARIVNLQKVLLGLSYPLTDFECVIRVQDESCPWNNGFFQLQSVGGVVSFDEVAEAKADDVDLDLSINLLTQLVVGFRTVSELAELGLVKVKEGKEDLFDSLFPRCVNFLRDFF